MRVLLFFIVILTALFMPLWSFVGIAFVYALLYTPYELLILAVCIDAQFGDPYRGLWFLYTLSASGIVLITVRLKPQLRFYR